jgi:hypothetical protein
VENQSSVINRNRIEVGGRVMSKKNEEALQLKGWKIKVVLLIGIEKRSAGGLWARKMKKPLQIRGKAHMEIAI